MAEAGKVVSLIETQTTLENIMCYFSAGLLDGIYEKETSKVIFHGIPMIETRPLRK